MLNPAELIKKKRSAQALSDDEIQFLIEAYTRGALPDYQMSALLMAIYFQGMNHQETLALTRCMLHSGSVADLSTVSGFKVDKHSTGGVGDKTSLILGPIVAACGLKVPMISGRGLGHTGGTLDKLESIPGFNVNLDLKQFRKQTDEQGLCFIGQTAEICPADKKMYALRDVTATVESLPLICASILSKKIAEGIDGLVLDVKYGNGAFMKTPEEAEKLARLLVEVAKLYGKKVSALLTDMSQPLGRYAGNALEVLECLDILRNVRDPLFEDTRSLSLNLSAEMLMLSGGYKTFDDALAAAEEALVSGRALKKFEMICQVQGGDLAKLAIAKHRLPVLSKIEGFITHFETESIGYTGVALKAGRLRFEDKIDPAAGIEFHKKLGDAVQKGEVVFTVHTNDLNLGEEAVKRLEQCFNSSLQKPRTPALIFKSLS